MSQSSETTTARTAAISHTISNIDLPFAVFLSLMIRYGVDFPYLGRAFLLLLVKFLEIPLLVSEKVVYSSKIEATQITKAPIFIVGHWRSGTSYLHNLLCQDPQFCFPSYMHVYFPKTFFMLDGFKSILERTLPSKRAMDEVKVGLSLPEEEEEGIVGFSPMSFYHSILFPRVADDFFQRYALLENLTLAERAAWQQDYVWFLKKISIAGSNRQLLLKNPVNTCRINTLIKIFPEARFIHIYRNPYEVFESTIKMLQVYTRGLRMQRLVPLEELQNGILQRYRLMMQAYDCQSAALPPDKLVEISFEHLRDRPLETVRYIYEHLNISNFSNAQSYFQPYLDSQKDYSQNVYNYTEANLRRVQEAWGNWIERWDYQSPSHAQD
ncbi:hypothetical protein C7B62_20330 [Pleurocapsa sp. CCALA 161]|uniref:sulfotransferase family protein n=1 Tax=Pleurocapsa sp. CCALA 161 TaxID=2107688 RepID=UPI000D0488B9|nr:sulfotransferase [Pleurocapsa sp. CCALA 161]PSB07303.1 hypothetical protein C7B62_20330 [Pleurocapsa sp. CCALA 161]